MEKIKSYIKGWKADAREMMADAPETLWKFIAVAALVILAGVIESL